MNSFNSGPCSSNAVRGIFAVLGLVGVLSQNPAEAAEPPAPTAKEALATLKEGNKRFAAGEVKHDHAGKGWRNGLLSGQHPFAIIVSCSDSRVPTELVFDQGFGDLFVIRNAGNVIATDVLASIEYGIAHLGCNLVLVMGHEGCGAVTAALMTKEEQAKEPLEVQKVLLDIAEGLEDFEPPEDKEMQVHAGVEANVHWSVSQLKTLLKERNVASASDVIVTGAVYELDGGKVRFFKKIAAPAEK